MPADKFHSIIAYYEGCLREHKDGPPPGGLEVGRRRRNALIVRPNLMSATRWI
jgi:hypothetical protein